MKKKVRKILNYDQYNESKQNSLGPGAICYTRYNITGEMTKVKIVKVDMTAGGGRVYLVSHNVEESNLVNAPEEILPASALIFVEDQNGKAAEPKGINILRKEPHELISNDYNIMY